MSDMGNIKIFSNTLSCFFNNNYGDGSNIVEIFLKETKRTDKAKFLGHFTVKKEAFLSDYDCGDDKLYKFKKGRWFVYLKKAQHFLIEYVDDRLHS